MYCDENRWRFFCLLRIIQESGVYQLGVPQGQGDSSAPSTRDPLICGFCLVTTPNTRGKTVEQSIVTWMFAREFITNCHPVAPQLTNKPCTNGRTDGRTDRQTDRQTLSVYRAAHRSLKPPHSSPLRTSSGVSFVRNLEKTDRIIMAPQCTMHQNAHTYTHTHI